MAPPLIDRRPKYKQIVDALVEDSLRLYLNGHIQDFRVDTMKSMGGMLRTHYGTTKSHMKYMGEAKAYARKRVREIADREGIE